MTCNVIVPIDMKYYYSDCSGWIRIPGFQHSTHSVYTVWDAPKTFMAIPWVKVVHRAIGWSQPVVHTHNLGGDVTRGPESHQAATEEHIAENMMWRTDPEHGVNPLNWDFVQFDVWPEPNQFEEMWRRMTGQPKVTSGPPSYDPDDPIDEPNPVTMRELSGGNWIIGGDCASCAHIMADALTAIGIGPYVQDHVNEIYEANASANQPEQLWTDGKVYLRAAFGSGALNQWQGVCKKADGAVCYSPQGPHMATYAIMNNAQTSEPWDAQPFDNVHAFEYYIWTRPKESGDGPEYPDGCYEGTFNGEVYIVNLNIPNPTDAAARDDK